MIEDREEIVEKIAEIIKKNTWSPAGGVHVCNIEEASEKIYNQVIKKILKNLEAMDYID